MNRKDQIKIERQLILNLMASIENQTNKCFHEILPEIDSEFHEQAYSDLMRLKVIRINLCQYSDELAID